MGDADPSSIAEDAKAQDSLTVDAPAATAVASLLAPGQAVPAMQQVVEALRSLGLQTGSGEGSSASGAGSGAASASADPAQGRKPALSTNGGSVTLQLDPEHLGRVSVTLRLNAEAVDIKIEVEHGQTLSLLDRDRHVLSAAIEASGRTAAVDLAPAAAPPAGQDAGQPASWAGRGGEGQALLDSSSGRSPQREDRPARGYLSNDGSHDEQATVSRVGARTDDGLYV